MAPCNEPKNKQRATEGYYRMTYKLAKRGVKNKVNKVSKRYKLVDLLPMPQIQRAYLKEEISFKRYIIWGSNLISF